MMTSANISVRDLAEDVIEAAEESAQGPPRFFLGAQQHGREGGTERKRVERREQNRNRDGDGELLVKLSGDAWNERGGNKHCCQDEADGNHRPSDFLHRLNAGVVRRQAVLDM